jgi:hypothetical protein
MSEHSSRKQYRRPSDFVMQYLRKHNFEQLDGLAAKMVEDEPRLAANLAGALAGELGCALVTVTPEPEPLPA